MSVSVEMVPNRLLLDPNFDGYKLSLKNIPALKREFAVAVDRALLQTNQYSLLHAKLFGLHNHLIPDHFDETDSAYFVDADWTVCKTYINPGSEELVGPIIVWNVPTTRRRRQGDYNISLKFVTEDLAVAGDGQGLLYILNTGCRLYSETFTACFSGEVAGVDEPFVIVDAVSKVLPDETTELHVLLLSLKQDAEDDRYVSIIHWITLSRIKDKEWTQIALRQLKTKGHVQYLALEKSCQSVYVVSDSECKFTVNSDVPVVENRPQPAVKKLYTWSQSFEDITVKVPLVENPSKDLLKVKAEANKIEVKYSDKVLIKGELYQKIDPVMTTWSIEQDCVEISLDKHLTGTMWTEFVKGDQTGEHVPEPAVVQQVHERLAHLCSENEAAPQSGTTFNSQQIEECDFENDKTATFARLCGRTNSAIHCINLGSHEVLMNPTLRPDLPPALGIRHDVDVCLWVPEENENNFRVVHEGTLPAFGYVQASKSNRKFLACPPDMSYSVICETTRHIFLYRPKMPVSSGVLRDRSNGRRIQNIAEQQVISVSNEEILGIYPTNSMLFVLQPNSITAFSLASS